jgi:hypothetical protein
MIGYRCRPPPHSANPGIGQKFRVSTTKSAITCGPRPAMSTTSALSLDQRPDGTKNTGAIRNQSRMSAPKEPGLHDRTGCLDARTLGHVLACCTYRTSSPLPGRDKESRVIHAPASGQTSMSQDPVCPRMAQVRHRCDGNDTPLQGRPRGRVWYQRGLAERQPSMDWLLRSSDERGFGDGGTRTVGTWKSADS